MKRQSLKKNYNLKSATWRPSTQKKATSSLKSKKPKGVKIPQSVIYVKEYFYLFFSTMEDVIQAQSKTHDWISWNFMIICLKHILETFFYLILM